MGHLRNVLAVRTPWAALLVVGSGAALATSRFLTARPKTNVTGVTTAAPTRRALPDSR